MSDFTVSLEGDDELRRKLDAIIKEMPEVVGAALYTEAEVGIMTPSKANYVPVDTGTLRASGMVEEPVITDKSITVTLGYGGAASAYALKQHEDLSYHHTVGQAKYLERPALEWAQSGISSLIGRLSAGFDGLAAL